MKDMRLIYLSELFYGEYGHFPEILNKPSRPYVCLTVEIDGYLFAIPFRHHISHPYAFMTGEKSGLDYTKAVLVNDARYIAWGAPRVEQAEYNRLKGNEARIVNGMRRYLKLFRKARQYPGNTHYSTILEYSALKYFI